MLPQLSSGPASCAEDQAPTGGPLHGGTVAAGAGSRIGHIPPLVAATPNSPAHRVGRTEASHTQTLEQTHWGAAWALATLEPGKDTWPWTAVSLAAELEEHCASQAGAAQGAHTGPRCPPATHCPLWLEVGAALGCMRAWMAG